jgi:hypothetical protein
MTDDGERACSPDEIQDKVRTKSWMQSGSILPALRAAAAAGGVAILRLTDGKANALSIDSARSLRGVRRGAAIL